MAPASSRPKPRLAPRSALTNQVTLWLCMVVVLPFNEVELVTHPQLFAGLGVIVAVSIAVAVGSSAKYWFGIDHRRAGLALAALAAVANIIGLDLIRWSAAGELNYVAFLMVLPTIWLSANLHFPGALLAIALSVVTQLVVPLGRDQYQSDVATLHGLSVVVVIAAVAMLIAHLVREQESQQRRLQVVTKAMGVVSGTLDSEGRLTAIQGRLVGPGRGLAVDEALRKPLLAENARTPLRFDRYPLQLARQGHEFVGTVVWTTAERDRKVALSVSAQRIDGTMLLVVHDVTASLASVLQEEQFLANVSHELKTPLTSISGYLELLEDEANESPNGKLDSAMVLSRLEVVGRNVERLQRLIMGLLETARILHTSPAEGEPCVDDFASMVRQQVESNRPRADLLDLTITVTGAEEPVELVNADSGQLRQVIDNLVTNALKYSHPGGRVEVAIEASHDTGTVDLVVRDYGIGIGAEDLEKLFTPYFRARTAVESGVEGTGIGLMVTRRIVRAHGGDLRVASVEGCGTTMTMTIPLVRT